MGTDNRRQMFDQHTGHDKDAFIAEVDVNRRRYREFGEESPTYINFRAQTSNETLRSVDISRLSQSSLASSTTRYIN